MNCFFYNCLIKTLNLTLARCHLITEISVTILLSRQLLATPKNHYTYKNANIFEEFQKRFYYWYDKVASKIIFSCCKATDSAEQRRPSLAFGGMVLCVINKYYNRAPFKRRMVPVLKIFVECEQFQNKLFSKSVDQCFSAWCDQESIVIVWPYSYQICLYLFVFDWLLLSYNPGQTSLGQRRSVYNFL